MAQHLPTPIAKNIIEHINQLIPQTVFELKTHRELNEDIFDFMNLYNIKQKTNSTNITDTEQLNRITTETLRVLTKNVGGKLKHKLETDSNLMLEVLMYQPHVIAIQEHQLNKMKRSTFKKIMLIQGYTKVTHHKAKMTE